MEKRKYGKDGVELSVVGFGGIVVMDETPETASQIVAQAVDRGINYFDVAPSYGNAQERLGPSLEPYRDSVFLACKTMGRTKAEAADELHKSLRLLRTDFFDLYQFHAVTTLAEVDQITGKDGALEAFVEAQEEGLIKYIGFSAHSEVAALALLDRFKFDSVLFPFNYVSWYQANFGQKILKKAQEKGVTRLALKGLAKRRLGDEKRPWSKCWYAPAENMEEASLALRFTLSLPITAAVSPSHAELLWWASDIADKLKPLSNEEQQSVAKNSVGLNPIFSEKECVPNA